jgi:hypothetical protein
MSEWAPAGKERKYALVERERRFLVDAVPDLAPTAVVDIVDRYLDGTRIRLRAATTVDGDRGGPVHYKLTQKQPAIDGGPGLLTTLYLDPIEYQLFDALPGAVLHKRRSSFPPFGVDIFNGALEGLVLAEAEFVSDEAMSAFVPPAWIGPEVTRDTAFSGGRLAHGTREDVHRALAAYGLSLGTASPRSG